MAAQARQREGSFRIWIVGTIVATVAATIGLLAALNYAKFDRLYQGHYAARFGLVLDDLQQSIENYLALGLPLSSAVDLGEAMRRSLDQNDEIRAILVLNTTRTVMTRVDRGTADPQAMRLVEMLGDPGTAQRRLLDEAALVALAAPLRTPFGSVEGAVVLVHSDAGRRAGLADLLQRIGLQTIGIILIGGLISTTAWMWYLQRLRRRILADAEALARIDAGIGGRDWLDPRLPVAIEQIANARRALDEIERTVPERPRQTTEVTR